MTSIPPPTNSSRWCACQAAGCKTTSPFRDVYQHADKVPSGPEPGTKAERMLPGDIIEFYRDKFGEDLPDIQSEYPDEGP